MARENEREIAENVAIATSTFYKADEVGKVRAGIAVKTVRDAMERGYSVSVVDSGSTDKFLKILEDLGACVLAEDPTVIGNHSMGKARRQAFKVAYETGRKIIVWTEPEKEHYIKEIWKTAVPILNDEADLVIPDRGNLDDYPTDQQHAEYFGNLLFKNLTEYELDIWSGPKTFSRKMINYFTDYKGEYGDLWESLFIPVLDIIHNKKRVLSVRINYNHPSEQTEQEEGNPEFGFKRYKQLENLIPALYAHWNRLKQK